MTLAASLEPEAKTEKAGDVSEFSACGAHVVSSIFAEVSVRYKFHPFFRASLGASLLVFTKQIADFLFTLLVVFVVLRLIMRAAAF